MTETGPAVFRKRFGAETRRRAHYPIPDAVEVMILPAPGSTDTGLDGASRLTDEPGVVGEICVRGKSIMSGYTGDAEANAAAFLANGFSRTGDLGRMHPDGYLQLTGRVKEMINKGGEKISPAEIEHLISNHEAVGETACLRLADEIYGEEIGK